MIHSMLYPGSSIKIGLWVILLFIGDHYIFSLNPRRRIEWNDFWLQIFFVQSGDHNIIPTNIIPNNFAIN